MRKFFLIAACSGIRDRTGGGKKPDLGERYACCRASQSRRYVQGGRDPETGGGFDPLSTLVRRA